MRRPAPHRNRMTLAALVCAAVSIAAAGTAAAQTIGITEPTSSQQLYIPTDDDKIAAEIQKYWLLMESNPYDASLHINLGNLYAMWGWNSEALVEYNKALALNPGSSLALTNLGTLYNSTGDSSRAVKTFKKAIKANPNAALAYYNLGTIYDARGKYDKAIEHYGRAIDLNPDLATIEDNPQAVYNKSLQVVLLKQFQERAGRKSLPLHWIPLPVATGDDPDAESDDATDGE